MVKTARYYLIPDNRDINKILWGLQDNTRAIKNKTVQLLWEWNNFGQGFKKEQGDFPDPKEVLNRSIRGYLYDKLKAESRLSTSNLSSTIQLVNKAFKKSLKDFLKGERSIITFKKNQPLDLHNRTIRLSHDKNVFYADITLMNKAAAKEYNNGSCSVHFKMQVRDKSSRAIIERCHDGVYSVSGSKLCYDQKKKMWYINLCYGFENTNTVELDKDRVLGVNLSMTHPVTASVFGEYGRLIIDGGELDHIRKTTEARRISLLLQSKNCGEGRIGHGYKKRVQPTENIGDKIKRSRDTLNHKYSKALIDFAVKKNCGTIQMEELTGIAKDKVFLKDWPYYDLQKKIEYKAKEQGIDVVYINPAYTSQRCSKCGCIHEQNRNGQEFICLECGYKTNADFNASQNIAIKDIDKIIKNNISEQGKHKS